MILEYDNTKWQIPNSDSPCEQWRIYFDQLKKEFGNENARLIWLLTWNEVGASSCLARPSFAKWLKKNEIDVSNMASRSLVGVNELSSNILGLGKGITSVLKYGVPVLLGGAVILILYLLAKSAKDAKLSDIAKLHPAGKMIG